MKFYMNPTRFLKRIVFEVKEKQVTYFLGSRQSITSKDDVVEIESGIRVADVKPKKRPSKTQSASENSEETQ